MLELIQPGGKAEMIYPSKPCNIPLDTEAPVLPHEVASLQLESMHLWLARDLAGLLSRADRQWKWPQ